VKAIERPVWFQFRCAVCDACPPCAHLPCPARAQGERILPYPTLPLAAGTREGPAPACKRRSGTPCTCGAAVHARC